MQVFHSNQYVIPLPDNHTFPIIKYAEIRKRLVHEGTLAAEKIIEPALATRDEILLVHTADYYDRFIAGELSERELRRLGLPYSQALVRRSRFSVAGTVHASRTALQAGASANLGGGTHHAFRDHGEGFCVFNDIAVAINLLRAEGRIHRAAVIDCDVHQGNGTAAIFATDPEVFTLSLHGEKNYPLIKQQSTVDVAFTDNTEDEEYLYQLEQNLAPVLDKFRPDMVFYQAGVDPLSSDKLGRLALTQSGLLRRDTIVLKACQSRSLPCVITLGGGYAKNVEDTIEAHCNTIRVSNEIFSQ